MNGLEKIAKEYRDKWLSHVRPEFQELAKRPEKITLPEYLEMRMNSYEQEEIMPNFDNETLIHFAEHNLKNCSPDRRRPASCYDDALPLLIAPLLIQRLKEFSSPVLAATRGNETKEVSK